MKQINLFIDDARWARLKEYADSERRHIRQQASVMLEKAVDALPEILARSGKGAQDGSDE